MRKSVYTALSVEVPGKLGLDRNSIQDPLHEQPWSAHNLDNSFRCCMDLHSWIHFMPTTSFLGSFLVP